MDAAGTEPALRDLKAPALAKQDIAGGNADVLQQHLGVAVRRVVETQHREHLLDLDAFGVERHQDLRLLLVARRVRIGLAHTARDLSPGISAAPPPPSPASFSTHAP